ncbi:MAG: phosphoserine transaminase, partial [bacterium]
MFGEFSQKFADAVATAPHLSDPIVVACDPGAHPQPRPSDADALCLTHNETSTGVAMQLTDTDASSTSPPSSAGDALVLVDATSAAGGLAWAPSGVDVYYFAPQKSFASDGGLWIACCSPR